MCNFSPVVRRDYRLGLPGPGFYREILNTDSEAYGGSNVGNAGGVHAEPVPSHGCGHSAAFTLPPLGVLWLATRLIRSPRRQPWFARRLGSICN